MLLSSFTFGYLDHRLRRLQGNEIPQFEKARPRLRRLWRHSLEQRFRAAPGSLHKQASVCSFVCLVVDRGGSVVARNSFLTGQRRIEEELLQWSSSGRQTGLSIHASWLAISTATRHGVSFGKIQVKHRFVLLFFRTEVEQ